MKLHEYPGLLGKWPPPAQTAGGLPVVLDHCLDVLLRAFCRSSSDSGHVRVDISTLFEKKYYVRQLLWGDEISARVFCDFLNKHQGKTIKNIGEIDATFLG
jgi:hypothetical protein